MDLVALLSEVAREDAATPPPAPAPAPKPRRYCYRCGDCLTVVFALERVPKGSCEACGGNIEYLGRVERSRVVQDHEACACDARCTSSTGPSCSCRCGGENHGTGATVTVTTDVGAVPRFAPKDPAKQLARATEYRAAVAAAKARLAAHWGGYLADYRAGVRIESYATWRAIRDDLLDLNKATRLKTHGGRLKALAAVAAPEVS